MDLAVRRVHGAVIVGLHQHRSKDVVDLTECHVLHPALFALLQPLRLLLARLHALRRDGSVIGNRLDDGIDLLLRTDAPLDLPDRVALANFAQQHRLPRIAWALRNSEPEPVVTLRPPVLTLSGVPVTPPPGAFLQSSVSGEAGIIDAVLAALPTKGTVAELFAGCGSITFALAKQTRVAAWEGDPVSIDALQTAANRAGLAGRIKAIHRDLSRQPLQAKELSKFSAVVLDPPFAGAAVQMPQIAAAKVPVVVYVSCNPATLARDARTLRMAGYRLVSAQPIDQFLWSDRLESVVVVATASA